MLDEQNKNGFTCEPGAPISPFSPLGPCKPSIPYKYI